jgi:hypothetical protein
MRPWQAGGWSAGANVMNDSFMSPDDMKGSFMTSRGAGRVVKAGAR